MSTLLLEESLEINIFFDETDSEYDDSICIQMTERCPSDEKLLNSDVTNMYITPEQACLLILDLKRAVEQHRRIPQNNPEEI